MEHEDGTYGYALDGAVRRPLYHVRLWSPTDTDSTIAKASEHFHQLTLGWGRSEHTHARFRSNNKAMKRFWLSPKGDAARRRARLGELGKEAPYQTIFSKTILLIHRFGISGLIIHFMSALVVAVSL